ncbi:MAG: ribonuclease P protein component [Thermodesulfobacteriota bacterium]
MRENRPFSFSRCERLLKRIEFKGVTCQGKRYTSPGFIVYVKENNLGRCRLGIAASRKVGKAIRRNRLKRLVREFFRLNKFRLPASCDILVVCRWDCQVDDLATTTEELSQVLFPLARAQG